MFMAIWKSKFAKIVGGIFLVLWIIIIVASGAGYNAFPVNWNFTTTGAFGDSFGPLSAVMAAVAAISAIGAFRTQQSEIARLKEREVDEDVRQELVRFERTFFQLLEAFRAIVSETDTQGSGPTKNGRDAFRVMLGKFENQFSRLGDEVAAWNQTSAYYRNDLNHYFRFLYHIVSFVNRSNSPDKYFYIQLLRASLSDSELTLIALNCAYGEGREKFAVLIEEYALLHNISEKSKGQWGLSTKFSGAAFGRG